ncbi:hypothetical protein ACJX0J_016535, partial [Zea mays]
FWGFFTIFLLLHIEDLYDAMILEFYYFELGIHIPRLIYMVFEIFKFEFFGSMLGAVEEVDLKTLEIQNCVSIEKSFWYYSYESYGWDLRMKINSQELEELARSVGEDEGEEKEAKNPPQEYRVNKLDWIWCFTLKNRWGKISVGKSGGLLVGFNMTILICLPSTIEIRAILDTWKEKGKREIHFGWRQKH